MFFAVHPLKRMIAEGEGPTQDFKKTISSAAKIAKSLVAFANTKGGRLLVGVRDNGSIAGADLAEESYMIENAAQVFCNPPVRFELFAHEYQGLRVLEVVIPESREKPHTAKGDDGRWWAYIRVNDQSVLASKVAVDVLRREAAGESTVISFSGKEKALMEYLDRHKRITLTEFCKLLNLSRRAAMRTMVDLVSAGVIRVHHTENPEFYTQV
ncbi:MAG: ATP-binding protein [Bacteroidetes bacterium]|nr:ATP-binding protein [Bacteroidota bacterium]